MHLNITEPSKVTPKLKVILEPHDLSELTGLVMKWELY